MTRHSSLRVLIPDHSPIAYYPIFAHKLGSVKAAILLSQLLYWTPRAVNRRTVANGWIWKSAREWWAETGLRRRELETAQDVLSARGLIMRRVKKVGNTPTSHYRVDLEAIRQVLGIEIHFV